MSTIKVNSIEPANAGSEDYFLARAWVSFNHATGGTVAADGNVSSITDGGTGIFTVNFSSSLSDANYAWSFGGKRQDDLGNILNVSQLNSHTKSTSAFQAQARQGSWTLIDFPDICITVTR